MTAQPWLESIRCFSSTSTSTTGNTTTASEVRGGLYTDCFTALCFLHALHHCHALHDTAELNHFLHSACRGGQRPTPEPAAVWLQRVLGSEHAYEYVLKSVHPAQCVVCVDIYVNLEKTGLWNTHCKNFNICLKRQNNIAQTRIMRQNSQML